MDAVDPALVDSADTALRDVPGVLDVGALRLRWVGHRLHAETAAAVVVDAHLSVIEAHQIAVNAEHRLLHTLPQLGSVTVHTPTPPSPPVPTPR